MSQNQGLCPTKQGYINEIFACFYCKYEIFAFYGILKALLYNNKGRKWIFT
jgi:hypothetical protein